MRPNALHDVLHRRCCVQRRHGVGRGAHGVDQGTSNAAFFQFVHSLDRGSSGAADHVFELAGVFAGLQHHLRRTKHRLCGEPRGDVPRQSGRDAAGTRDLPLLAAMAVGQGLDSDAAFEALTLGAARAMDVADQLGSLEFGKRAAMLVLDGDPLASTSSVQYVISDGEVVVEP